MFLANHLKNEIIRLHINEGYSTRALALQYQIGRTTVQNRLRDYRKKTNTEPQEAFRPTSRHSTDYKHYELLNEINDQLAILNSFQKELERWGVQKPKSRSSKS